MLEPSEADEAAAEREHRFVHLGAAFVADEQPLELVQVREGALDDPANAAEAGAVVGAAASDHRPDPARTADQGLNQRCSRENMSVT